LKLTQWPHVEAPHVCAEVEDVWLEVALNCPRLLDEASPDDLGWIISFQEGTQFGSTATTFGATGERVLTEVLVP
jgi:hypothetical protein